LQALLAERNVECGVADRQLHRTTLLPLDRRTLSCRSCPSRLEHRYAEIQTDDSPTAPNPRGCGPRDYASPAGDVDHAFARLWRSHLDEVAGPGTENTWHEVSLIVLRHASDKLPLSLGTHASSPHYSITSSARASSDGGMVRPRALAVFRLMTNSNLVGRSTGRSAGLAPLRILSTNDAARRKLSATSTP